MKRYAVYLRLVVAVTLLAYVLHREDPSRIWARLVAAPWWAYGASIGFLGLNSGIQALRIQLLLPRPVPPWHRVLRSVLLGNFYGLFLPTGGGEAAKLWSLQRETGALAPALAALGTSRVLELLPWSLLCLWGALVVLPEDWPWLVPVAAGSFVAMLVVFLGAVTLIVRGDRLAHRVPARIAPFAHQLASLVARPVDILACASLAVPFGLLNCAAVWAVLHAYGVGMPYSDVLGLIPTLDVLISLPITVSGVGVREETFQLALAARGVPADLALAIAFTRWTGEIARSVAGGLLFVTGSPGGRRTVVTDRD